MQHCALKVYERMMEDPLAMLRGRSLAGHPAGLKGYDSWVVS